MQCSSLGKFETCSGIGLLRGQLAGWCQSCPGFHFRWHDPTQPINWVTQPNPSTEWPNQTHQLSDPTKPINWVTQPNPSTEWPNPTHQLSDPTKPINWVTQPNPSTEWPNPTHQLSDPTKPIANLTIWIQSQPDCRQLINVNNIIWTHKHHFHDHKVKTNSYCKELSYRCLECTPTTRVSHCLSQWCK